VDSAIEPVILGRTGKKVSRVGLGGEGILRTYGRADEAALVLETAYSSGITYYDSARAYSGSEGYYGQFWERHPDRIDRVFQTSKTAERTYQAAMDDLAHTLRVMNREYLDLWQIHDLRTSDELRRLEAPGGALAAFYEARESGLVRAIGVTGHHDPEIIRDAIIHWDLDTVLLPVNPVEAVLGDFINGVIPAAREKGMGVIGMKALGNSRYIIPQFRTLPETLIMFALAQDVDVIIVGCSTPAEVRTLANTGSVHTPPDDREQSHIVEKFRPYARRLAFYRGIIP
jgi:aryl-alcohol dehydrogenase-like predicted oxidoreductase